MVVETNFDADDLIVGERLEDLILNFAASFIAGRWGIDQAVARRLVEYLWKFGLLVLKRTGEEGQRNDIVDAIRALRKLLGLGNRKDEDSIIDPPILAALDLPRCGCANVQAQRRGRGRGRSSYRWNKKDLAYYIQSFVPNINRRDQEKIFRDCYNSWERACGLKFNRVHQKNAADIVIFASPIDGPGRVLAQAQLPPGDDRQLWCQIDSRDIFKKHGHNGAGVYLYNTFNHETGHNIGFDHSQTSDDLMYFQYQDHIKNPQSGDIDRARDVYGPSRSTGGGVDIGGNGKKTRITIEGPFTARVENL